MVRRIEKAQLGEVFSNGTYTAELFDVEANKRYLISIQQSENTESDIVKMIKIPNGSLVNEYSFEYDFLKSIIKKYAL